MDNVQAALYPEDRWANEFAYLGRDPISFEDTISPRFHEFEREAVFRESWLFIGRVEHVAKPGQYFTKEIEVLKTSVLVTRDQAGQVHAFYNVCPHRGNKLVWDTHANVEVQGQCRNFVCKLHGIGFAPDGSLSRLTDPSSWYGEQGRKLRLAKIPMETWNGFIFVNLRPGGPKESLREFIGEPFWQGFDGLPFDLLTERHKFVLECNANWKLMMDGFSEGYHGATTHQAIIPIGNFFDPDELKLRQQHFGIYGRHRQFVAPRIPDGLYSFPIEELAVANPTGPRYPMPFEMPILPHGADPTGFENWGTSANMLWPNMHLQVYYPGYYVTYAFWPLGYDRMRFELEMYMPQSRNFSELFSHKVGAGLFVEAALQDFSLLEATQQGLENRAFAGYPVTDQEILVREFHHKIYEAVRNYQEALGARPA
ncbi:MAG TPA: SRPBCC family protein [Stellaceae bacterium]|nr:SRPBCC family protein [Stellaceae bacterium]